MTRYAARFMVMLLLGGILWGQGSWRLKRLQAAVDDPTSIRRLRSDRVHYLAHLDSPESAGSVGIQILRPVPDGGSLISAPADLFTPVAGVSNFRLLRRQEKISEAIHSTDTYFVVEFHPDVTEAEAREVVRRAGMRVRENPDLASGHLLVQGRAGAVGGLASWDEVAYIFPAASDLINGAPVRACAAAANTPGSVGQYIATMGDGWDGPGLGGATLNYAYAKLTAKLPRDTVISELNRAMAEWARVAKLNFTYTDVPNGARTLSFLFASGAHGDAYPFDGAGRVLAHTFYPAPPNPEPLAGDLHLDDDEHWSVGADIDLYSVVLHELGHALGLGHSDRPGSVMYPYYSHVGQLTPDDVAAVLSLYAAAGTDESSGTPLALTVTNPTGSTELDTIAFSGTTSGGFGEVRVTWMTDRGATGTATGVRAWNATGIPLAIGPNLITITATDTKNVTASKTFTVTRNVSRGLSAAGLLILSPAPGNVAQSSVIITGTASNTSGIVAVRWANSRGGSGIATGTTSWKATVPLQSGSNTITITAAGQDGTNAIASLALTYTTTAVNDSTPPVISITNPSLATISTSSSSIRISGAARDNVGVTQVTWSSSTGLKGIAEGTNAWTADVPLLVGNNAITLRAHDSAGNSAWRSVTVTRR